MTKLKVFICESCGHEIRLQRHIYKQRVKYGLPIKCNRCGGKCYDSGYRK